MKVLQILPELNIGGVERGTVDLSRKLLLQGHQPLVISNGGKLVKDLELLGARHIRLPVHHKSLFSILANIPKLTRILSEEKVDLVHARSRVPALIAFLACRRTGINFITTCHGYYSQNFFSRVMGWGKCVIVSSTAIAQHMIKDFGVPQERIKLIPRGVDLEEFKFSQKPQPKDYKSDLFTIGVVGRLSPIKGHTYFLQSLAKVIRVSPRVKALIVGAASPGKEKYEEELKILTRRLGLDGYVEFIGRENNISRLYSRLDLLVLPTVTQEAFGRVLIEAGACGVPVVATRVGGVVDIIQDGINGLLVAPRDSADLASGIVKLLKEPKLRQKFCLAARKNVEDNFTLEQMAQKTIKIYEQVRENLRILVIKLSALGDLILIVPSLRALRKTFPQAQIIVLVGSPFKVILQNCPYIDQIIEFPLEGKSYINIIQISSVLRTLNFDITVDLQNNRRSHLLAYLSACNRRFGYHNGKFSFLLNKKVKQIRSPLSPVEHQGRTLNMLGITSVGENLELWPQENDENWTEEFLKLRRVKKSTFLIGVNLGAGVARPAKRWKIEEMAALLDKIKEAGMEVVVTGRTQDKALAKMLTQLVKNGFIDAVGQTSIMQLACLIKRCAVYITSDSAPLHIAYAVKTPVIALFGPTDPRRHTLVGPRQIVIKKDLDCSPCYKRRCRRKHLCMEGITAEEVFEAVQQLLK